MQIIVILESHALLAIFCQADRFSWGSTLVYQVYSEQVYHAWVIRFPEGLSPLICSPLGDELMISLLTNMVVEDSSENLIGFVFLCVDSARTV